MEKKIFCVRIKSATFATRLCRGLWSSSSSALSDACSQNFLSFFKAMYAIVDIAGQQFKVEAGNEIFVNRLAADKGAAVVFDKVLLVDAEGAVKLGTPYVEGAVVKATVLDDTCKADKVLVFKKKRRKGYQKLNGHRQYLSKIKIDEIA